MMKVKICNKKLWTNFIKIVSTVAAILSFILTIVDIDQKTRLIISLIVLFSLADRLGRGGIDKDKRKEVFNDIEKFREIISKSNE